MGPRCGKCGGYTSFVFGKRECHCWLISKSSFTKPPIGIMPRKLWDDQRLSDLRSALDRRLAAGFPAPPEWIEEYNELVNRSQDRVSK